VAKFEFNEQIFLWIFSQIEFNFEWDTGNEQKSFIKHGITCTESESVFKNTESILPLGKQISPSYDSNEDRFGVFGTSCFNKYLFISFTIRNSKIRIISARELNNKEREKYEQICKESR
jgi:uncharacterized DUF497 family protein